MSLNTACSDPLRLPKYDIEIRTWIGSTQVVFGDELALRIFCFWAEYMYGVATQAC